MRMEFAAFFAIPSARIFGFVQKRSSPTSSIFFPSSFVSFCQPDQSFSASPSSMERIGYFFTQSLHSAINSSDEIFFFVDLKNMYSPLSHISLDAGSRQSETSLPGV